MTLTTAQRLAAIGLEDYGPPPTMADLTEVATPCAMDLPPSLASQIDAAALDLAGIQNVPPPEYLIAGVVATDSLVTTFGPPGSSKTFVSLSMALSVAHGVPWMGRTVKAGPVVYVVAEGVRGVGQRVAAWLAHHKPGPALHPIHFVARPVNLYQREWAAALATWCIDKRPVLVVVDTLARCAVGAEENSARDMGVIVDALDTIRAGTGAAVNVVHHTGKDTSRGGRGSNALEGAATTEMEVSGTRSTTVITFRKVKDDEEPAPIVLERVAVAGSLVLVPGTQSVMTSGALDTYNALRRIEVPGGVAPGAWMDASELARSTFYEHRAQLLRAHKVRNLGSDRQPRYATAEGCEDDE